MHKRVICLIILQLSLSLSNARQTGILIEAESFNQKGGWVLDNQAATVMGSPYLLAHGLGIPVEDAETSFEAKKEGTYRLWVRTRDWTRTWGRTESPGRFQVRVNDQICDTLFGTKNAEWSWQDGGLVELKRGKNAVVLHDLTGFDGRCDALFLTMNLSMQPPWDSDKLASFRNRELNLPRPQKIDTYDLVVVGGGIAGCCAAVSAARLGCKVALIQNRPVLGGNNSSEVRVGLSGLINKDPFPRLGNLMDELGGVGFWTEHDAHQDTASERSRQILSILDRHPEKMQHNGGPASNYEDEKKLRLVEAEPNITLFLNTEVVAVKMKGKKIESVIGRNIESGQTQCFKGSFFADCTGDGTLGFLSGADYRMGRESKDETNEPSAPDVADSLTMGTSVQWYSERTDIPQPFPECPWALQFTDETCFPITRGDWEWETGLGRDQVQEIEYIRDYALRAVYGNWAYLKNHYREAEAYSCLRLAWVAYIGGKRESRRLMGDHILTEQDVLGCVPYPDSSFTTTWNIDLHYPNRKSGFEGEPFTAYSVTKPIHPYAVPYRCLYSRNVNNLFMAGRNISVTHIALGTVRVMRTGGMMGEVVGMAASLCRRHAVLPRDIYTRYLPELRELMQQGVGTSGFPTY